MVVEQRPDVGEPQRAGAALPGIDLDAGELALHLPDLPLVGAVHLRQRGHPARQRVEPVGERLGAGEPVGRHNESVDVLGEPAGQLDPVAPDVVERQGGAEPGLRVVGHGHAGQHPVEPEPPRVLEVADAERFPVVGVESPSDARLAHPAGHRVEVVVDEAETAADRLCLGEVEHRAGRGAAAGHVEKLGRDAQQGVGARQRAVGQLDPEPVRRVAALDNVTETERRGDQRRVVLDVRAHHQDVAWLERAFAANRILGAVLEQPKQHLAEHLHLPGRAVAPVHLDRPVGRVEGAALRSRGVIAQVGLEPAEQRVGRVGQRGRRGDLVVVNGPPEAALQLALVAAERCEQRVPDPAVADVLRARHLAGQVGQPLPEGSAGVGQPQVQVVMGRQVAEQLDLRDGHPGVAEQRDAWRQVTGTGAQPLQRRGVPLVRVWGGDSLREGTPQWWLPGQVAIERVAEPVGGVAGGPVDQQLRPLCGVRREQAGEPPCDGVAAAAPELRLVAGVPVPQVQRQSGCPRLVEAAVEHRQQRPGKCVGRPRIVVAGAGQLGDERPREPELDAGADAVTGALGGGAEPVRQPLAQPPLHPASRHEHQLGCERVLRRRRQQLAERVGEQVGPRGAVEVEHHSATLCAGTDASARRRGGSNSVSNPLSRCCSTQTVGWTLSYSKCAQPEGARHRPQNPSRSSSASAAVTTAAIASGLPWNLR